MLEDSCIDRAHMVRVYYLPTLCHSFFLSYIIRTIITIKTNNNNIMIKGTKNNIQYNQEHIQSKMVDYKKN